MATNTLYIGHNVGNKPTWTSAEIVSAYQEVTGRKACTAIAAAGWWEGQAEATTIIVDALPLCRAAVATLCYELQQDCILWDNGHGPAFVRPTDEELTELQELQAVADTAAAL